MWIKRTTAEEEGGGEGGRVALAKPDFPSLPSSPPPPVSLSLSLYPFFSDMRNENVREDSLDFEASPPPTPQRQRRRRTTLVSSKEEVGRRGETPE